MSFIEILPKTIKNITANGVAVCFPKSGSNYEYRKHPKSTRDHCRDMLIAIGPKIYKKLEMKYGDIISISYDDKNHRMLRFKKSKNDVGYKLRKKSALLTKTFNNSLFIRMKCNIFVPNTYEKGLKTVRYNMYQDEIIIFTNEPIKEKDD